MSRNEERINRELREQLTTVNTQNIGKGELKGIIRRLADNFHSYDKLPGMKFYSNHNPSSVMTYKEIGFRGVYQKFLAVEIDETIEKICKSYPYFDNANCVLVYGYIDHTAGMTLELIACGHSDQDGFVFYDSPKDSRDIIRIGAVEELELYVIDDEDNELYNRYAQRLEVVLRVFSVDEGLARTREMEFLDSSRHPHYPDDIQLYLQTKSEEFEVCWLRIIVRT